MKLKDDINLLDAYSKVLKENCGIMSDMVVAPTETELPEYTSLSILLEKQKKKEWMRTMQTSFNKRLIF